MKKSLLFTGLVFLMAACGGGDMVSTNPPPPPPPPPPIGGSTVTVVDYAFQPTVVSGEVGQPVSWTNAAGEMHTITSDNGTFDDSLAAGATYTLIFANPGSYTYHCKIHPQMTGVIIILP